MIRIRGRRPRSIACRAMENAPEITAWLAMTVATVASSTRGRRATDGAIRKNGFDAASGLARTSAPCPA